MISLRWIRLMPEVLLSPEPIEKVKQREMWRLGKIFASVVNHRAALI